jgi:hypothetical protein
MSPVRRFRQFLHDVVLGGEDAPSSSPLGASRGQAALRPQTPVVIFLDEIDVTLSLPFPRDDFFGLIRSAHESRAEDPRWRRLTFCLIGVAAPLDLVADPERTPFNNSFGVRIDDFTREEARTFLPGLARTCDGAEALLDAVVDWTGGHPALTQRLCYRLTQEDAAQQALPARERVDALVRELFLSSGRITDPILLDAERRFAGDRPEARISVMLHLYRRLLDGEPVPADGNNPRQFGLRIAGLAAEREEEDGSFLRVRNRIFASVFNHAWVEEKLARRFLTEPLQIWKDSGRKDDHVLRGGALEIALTWAKGREDITPDEQAFVQASLEVLNREQAERQQAEVDRARRERAEQQVRAQRGVVSILAVSIAIVAASAIFAIIQYQRTQAALQQEREVLAREQEARALLVERHTERVRRAEEDVQQAQKELDEALRKRDLAVDAKDKAKAEAEEARTAAERIKMKALRGEVPWYKVPDANTAAEKKKDAAGRLAIAAQRADKNVREAQRRHDEAIKTAAVLANKPLPESVTSSVEGTLEAERAETQRLRNELDKSNGDLATANAEIARLNRNAKDLTERLDKLKVDYEITRRELEAARKAVMMQRFATPPASQRGEDKGSTEVYRP